MWVPKAILPAGMRMIAPAMDRMVETWFIYGHAAELCVGTGDLRLRHESRLLKPLHTSKKMHYCNPEHFDLTHGLLTGRVWG